MSEHGVLKELPGIALTIARYGMAENMARKVHNNESIVVNMIGFVAADIADGAILRCFDMDTPLRRITDGVVDHVSVARVAFAVAEKYPDTKPYLEILAARAAIVGILNAVHLSTTGEVTKGRSKQKATNLATAAFALAALTGNRKVTHISGVIAATIAAMTVPSHLKSIGKKHPDGIRKL